MSVTVTHVKMGELVWTKEMTMNASASLVILAKTVENVSESISFSN